MFDRFTDRARKVMGLAIVEAQRLNNNYVGTDHILLGLIKEGRGVGAQVLGKEGIELNKLRIEIEKVVQRSPAVVNVKDITYTPEARDAIERSYEFSRSFGHNYIGTEHLLYGILNEPRGVASKILRNLGLEEKTLQESILDSLGAVRKEGKIEQIPSIEQIAEKGYWKIPRGDGWPYAFVNFLGLCGYTISGLKPGESDKEIKISISGIELGEVPKEGGWTIFYNASNPNQLSEAVRLRRILDLNDAKYAEKPSRQEIVKILRESHNQSLADLIEEEKI